MMFRGQTDPRSIKSMYSFGYALV